MRWDEYLLNMVHISIIHATIMLKEVRDMKVLRRTGVILLGIWLIVEGLQKIPGVTISFPFMALIVGAIAIISGVLLIISFKTN